MKKRYPSAPKIESISGRSTTACEVPAFVTKLREAQTRADRLRRSRFEFLSLTAVRLSECTDMTWSEVDLQERLWTVPAERTKTRKPHAVPLSDRCAALLKRQAATRSSEFVWPGRRDNPIGDRTLYVCLTSSLGIKSSLHGLRATFRTWAGEKTEAARNHRGVLGAHCRKWRCASVLREDAWTSAVNSWRSGPTIAVSADKGRDHSRPFRLSAWRRHHVRRDIPSLSQVSWPRWSGAVLEPRKTLAVGLHGSITPRGPSSGTRGDLRIRVSEKFRAGCSPRSGMRRSQVRCSSPLQSFHRVIATLAARSATLALKTGWQNKKLESNPLTNASLSTQPRTSKFPNMFEFIND